MAPTLPLPKHHQTHLVLHERPADAFGAFAPGEVHLVKEFGVARVTVRRAPERLMQNWRIERAAGCGSVALAAPTLRKSEAAAPRPQPPFADLLESIVDISLRTRVKMLQCEALRCQYQMQLSRIGEIDAKMWIGTEPPAQFH